MAEINTNSKITMDVKIHLTLTLEEAKALSNITVYGHKPFTDWFYRNLGKTYLKPHENGLISLFNTIKSDLEKQLHNVDEIYNAINKIPNWYK